MSHEESFYGRLITEKGDISKLARDIETGTHNMWVEMREKDFGAGKYDPVVVEVEITVSECEE